MSHRERTGIRNLLYSGWHRPARIRRYLGAVKAAMVSMVDVDACEYCCRCNTPVALIETQQSTHGPKSARVTQALARMAGIPAFSVSYEPTEDGTDIARFQVQQIAPDEGEVRVMLPRVYAYWLYALRERHACGERRAA